MSKKNLLVISLISIFFIVSFSSAEQITKEDKTKKNIENLENINKVFSSENENIISTLDKIPVRYLEYLKKGITEYNGELDFVISKASKGENIGNINSVFMKYRELRKVSNILSSYNDLSKAIELNYKIINTTNTYIGGLGLENQYVSDMRAGLNDEKLQLDNLVSQIEKSLTSVMSVNFDDANSNVEIISFIKKDYNQNKNSYQIISNDILQNISSL